MLPISKQLFALFIFSALTVACIASPTLLLTPATTRSAIATTPSPLASTPTLEPSRTPSSPTPLAIALRSPTLTVPPAALVKRVTPTGKEQCLFNGHKVPNLILDQAREPSGFAWSGPVIPLGDTCLRSITVDPSDENIWYVNGQGGLYITRDAGVSWEHPFTGGVSPRVQLDPNDSRLVYVIALDNASQAGLFWSSDRGRTWKPIGSFDRVGAFLIGRDATIYLTRTSRDKPSGVSFSRDHGATWQFTPFDFPVKELVEWDMAEDPLDGTLYVGVEVADHSTFPPFFRSRDKAKTWRDVHSGLVTHGVSIQIQPKTGYVFVLEEGRGIYGSADHGDTWAPITLPSAAYRGFGYSFLLDPTYPNRLFATQFSFGPASGAYFSEDGGITFKGLGLGGVYDLSLALNGASSKIYAAVFGSGVYLATIPANYIATPIR